MKLKDIQAHISFELNPFYWRFRFDKAEGNYDGDVSFYYAGTFAFIGIFIGYKADTLF